MRPPIRPVGDAADALSPFAGADLALLRVAACREAVLARPRRFPAL